MSQTDRTPRTLSSPRKWGRLVAAPALACALGVALLASNSASLAKVDLLQVPAMPSSKATRSILMDVRRAGDALFAVGEFGQVLKSTDNGASWVAGKVPTSITLTAVAFANEALGYAVGHDGVILKTEDGGANWAKVLDGSALNEFILQAAQKRADALAAQLDELPDSADENVRSELELAVDDAQFLVENAQADIEVGPSKPLMDVLVTPTGTVVVAGSYNQLLRSTDQGATWEYLGDRTNNIDNYHFNSLIQTRTGELWLAGEHGTVLTSSDEGQTWISRNIDYDGSIFTLVEVPTTRTIVAMGLRGNLYRLEFGSTEWQQVETDLSETFRASTVLSDGSAVVVGTRGLMARSNDDFRTLTVTRRADKLPSAAVIQLSESELLLAGMRGFLTVPLSQFQ